MAHSPNHREASCQCCGNRSKLPSELVRDVMRSAMFLNYWSRSLARVLVAFAFIVSLSAQQSSAPQDGVYNCTNGFILTILALRESPGRGRLLFQDRKPRASAYGHSRL